jgi:hypothetical protein
MDTKWVKDSFDKGKLEILKFAKVSKIKIDITSLNKKKDERVKLLGNKVLELIENGELEAELFEPDYTYIRNIEKEIKTKQEELTASEEEEAQPAEETTSEEIEIVTIESQKVLTANSIPVEPEAETAEEKKGE